MGVAGNATTILINNLDQTPSQWYNPGDVVGQAFTSGAAVGINSVTFRYDYGGYVPSQSAYLTINDADTDGKIGANILATWTAHSSSSGLVTFTGYYPLEPNKTYWLLIHDSPSTYARVTMSTSYNANFGATLPSTYNNYESSTGYYYSLSEGPLMFRVTVPDAGFSSMLLGLAMVGLGCARRLVK